MKWRRFYKSGAYGRGKRVGLIRNFFLNIAKWMTP